MTAASDAILENVLVTIHRLSGRRLSNGADKLIGAVHGVTGWDSIDLLMDMEEAYGIDLQPLAESRATERKGWFRAYRVGGDATPRELAHQIASLVASANERMTPTGCASIWLGSDSSGRELPRKAARPEWCRDPADSPSSGKYLKRRGYFRCCRLGS